jgi:hypothetical protein
MFMLDLNSQEHEDAQSRAAVRVPQWLTLMPLRLTVIGKVSFVRTTRPMSIEFVSSILE